MSGSIVFEGVSKSFGDIVAVDDLSFSIEAGEFFSILGPSGCGKTTLLRLIAGFEQPDKGRIFIDGQDITKLTPNKRPVNTVFQHYALFPNLTVRENIAFGLRIAKRSEKEIRIETDRMLQLIQMEAHGDKKTDQISGGQKQRVAIARALINKPRVLLLDEPLTALDLKLRQKMLVQLNLIHDEVGITFVFITHDQTEAIALSDRIAVIQHGKIEQLGTPVQLYEAPKSSFVSAFIGDTNFLEGQMIKKIDATHSIIQIEGFPNIICATKKPLVSGGDVHLSIRPEKIHITRERPSEHSFQNILQGTVDDIIYKGDHTKFWIRVDDYRIGVLQQHNRLLRNDTPLSWGDPVWIYWYASDSFVLEKYSASDQKFIEDSIIETTEEEEELFE